jgi:hypothetical protein
MPARMSDDAPPDRLSNDPASRFHDASLLARGIGIRFNGVEKTNVEQHCVSEGWIRVAVGMTLDRRGKPLSTHAFTHRLQLRAAENPPQNSNSPAPGKPSPDLEFAPSAEIET